MQAWIYDAVRTPRGKARAEAASPRSNRRNSSVDWSMRCRAGAMQRAKWTRSCWDVSARLGDQGANIALVSKLHAGVADEAYAFTLNNYCVSGLTAIGQTARQSRRGRHPPRTRGWGRNDVARPVHG